MSEEDPKKSLAFCFDNQTNLPLPLTNTDEDYYLRQLWIHNLGNHNFGTKKATMVLYAEHFAPKGPNEVISALKWYIENNITRYTEQLHVFMDNCFVQCKNKYLLAFWKCTSDYYNIEVKLYYSVPGQWMEISQ